MSTPSPQKKERKGDTCFPLKPLLRQQQARSRIRWDPISHHPRPPPTRGGCGEAARAGGAGKLSSAQPRCSRPLGRGTRGLVRAAPCNPRPFPPARPPRGEPEPAAAPRCSPPRLPSAAAASARQPRSEVQGRRGQALAFKRGRGWGSTSSLGRGAGQPLVSALLPQCCPFLAAPRALVYRGALAKLRPGLLGGRQEGLRHSLMPAEQR